MSKLLLDSDLQETAKLLQDSSTNIDFQDNLGRTALFYADRNKSLLLLNFGIDYNKRDKKDLTAFDYTVRKAEQDINKLDVEKVLMFFRMGFQCYEPKNQELKNLLLFLYNEAIDENYYNDILSEIMRKNNKKLLTK